VNLSFFFILSQKRCPISSYKCAIKQELVAPSLAIYFKGVSNERKTI